jgi:two-component system, sensor histidine kinase PdtaS
VKMKLNLTFRKSLYVGISFLAIYLLVLLLLKNLPQLAAVFSYTMLIILYLAVVLSLYLASKASRIYGKRTQIAWIFLTFAVLTSVLGSVLWAVVMVYYNQNPTYSLANIFYLMFFPLFFVGIMMFPSPNTTPRQRFKKYFDILIIMFSLSLVLWIFFITPALQDYNGDITPIIFNLTYVIGGFLLLLSLMDLLFNRIKPDMYAPSLILLGAISVLIITECVYTYQTIHGSYVPGNPGDIGWIIGYMLIGLAGISQFTHQKINLDSFILNFSSLQKNHTLTPYLALAGVSTGYISLIWAYNTFNPNLTFLEFGVGVLIFLVVSRQFLSISENKHLFRKAQEEISLRKEISKSLKDSESAYRTIFENTGTATVIIDEENIIALANTEFEKLSGYPKEELERTKSWTDFVVSEDLERMKEHNQLRITETEPDPKNYEFRLTDRTGNVKNIFVVAVIIPGTRDSLVSLLDVTERKNAEAEIRKSLKEKETLLKEIHHRVKNNLTVISSLLNLQSRYIKDKDDLIMFKESQSRAKSMALIHQKLYDSSDLKRIDFGEYISTLATEMFHTYVSDASHIKLNLNVEDVMLDINTAIPLGLILNELLTNSMKYAFPSSEFLNKFNNKKGNIDVKLFKNKKNYVLSVEDDGIGFPEDIELENTDSLGLQLINSLTNQIDGKIDLDRSNGTSFKIYFKEGEY